MKTKIYILVLLFLAIMGIINAQTDSSKIDVKLSDFNFYFWYAYADKLHLSPTERNEFISSHQKTHLDLQQKLNQVNAPISQTNAKSRNQNNVLSGSCTNIDFENGSLSGWNPICGFNPLYAANPSGCCLIPGGQQTIMSGAALDPAGLFPVVAPGGSFSLRLGNSLTGGQADRIEQTFLVTAANANFTYKYAVVMEDPGHTLTQQPSFQVEMLDSIGNQIPCTFYNVAAGNNIPGFMNSTTMTSVVYKPWSSVVADLTALIGQNITIRFTTYDCSLGGHFGYAYIDGSCLSFVTGSNDTICAGTQKTYCAPNGFLTTTWNGPGMVNNTNQCISASNPGIYTCQTVLIPGCPGPTFTYTLSNSPKPLVSFSPVSNDACSLQYAFTNLSNIGVGSITSNTWTFGAATSTVQNPTHNFPLAGNYSVTLIATSNKGCKDTAVQNITIYPYPQASFTASASCVGSNVTLTNSSSLTVGSITNYTWSFGNGNTSNLTNPTITYTGSGSYAITLSVTSNQNCVASQTNNVTIYPKPNASFNSVTLSNCTQQYTFTNTSGISSGVISSYNWNFGSSSSAVQNPVNTFPAPGFYTVSMIATSNNNCKDTAYKNIAIYPFPNVAFLSQPVCLNSSVNFTNTSTIISGSINSYTWSFGNGNTSALLNPVMNYTNSGNYVISLSATSNQNCISTATNNLVIYALPTATINTANFCRGNVTTFSNNASVPGGTISSYTWDFGDGNITNAPNPGNLYSSSGSYAVSLTLISNQNCMASFTTNVNINPLPVLSYNVTNVCHGNTTIFNNTSSILSGSIASYTWSFGNASISNAGNPSLTYLNPGTYVITLIAKSNLNCVASNTANLVIYPLPVISFTANNVCFGDTTLFTNNNAIGSGSINAFTWNFGDGNTSNVLTPGHSYAAYGNKVVTLSATSNQNCSATYSANVMINPLPLISFSSNNVCQGVNTAFLNNSSIATGSINSWNWDFGNGQVLSGVRNPLYQYPSAGNYTVLLKATSLKNCSSLGSIPVKVFSNPTASFVTNNSCFGDQSNFSNMSSIVNPDQITSYTWNMGNGKSSSFINPVQTYTAAGNYQVKLTVTTNNNCTSTFTAPITIYSLPQVGFIPTSACRNQATQFTNQTTISQGFIAKSRWDFENDGIWDDTVSINPVKTYPIHGNYLCKLEVVSNFQCKASKTNNVTVHGNPTADFSTQAVCLGDRTTFTNKSTTDDGAITSYQWDFNGDNVVDNVLPNATTTYSANGTYLVKLEVQTQFGCTNVKSMSGQINAMAVPSFVSKNNKGCPLLNVNFQNTSSIPTGSIISATWDFGDASLPDYSQNPTHTFGIGSYNVSLKLVSDSGCVNTLMVPGFVTVYPKPVAAFNVEPDEIDENEPVVNVRSSAQNAVFTSYFINDGSRVNTADFTHSFKNLEETKPMIVQIVKNEFNCADTTFEIIKIKPAFVIYIPNTFTPNGDGVNDGFMAKGVGITKFSMQIFDRWGHMLFESNDIANAWDGTTKGSEEPIMQDVYVWKASVIDLFNKVHDLSGHVSLIR